MLANIAVTDAYLVDGSGESRLEEVVVGQMIGVKVRWSTAELPANIATYQVEFRVDGVPLRSDEINWGAGSPSGTSGWYRTGWYASPGIHTVEIVVDVDNEVAENNEGDNTFVFQFTPITANFPQRMEWPLPLTPLTEIFWSNYNDVDPTNGDADFQGRNATYDGHDAIDARLTSYAGQDRGVEIYAALDGVVTAINDGEFDRQSAFNSSASNLVIIDHGNGWQTRYLHMRRDSVQVQVGQSVVQGERLGLVGSSGNSTASHLHLELRYRGLPVETYYDPETYWVAPADYVFDDVYLVDAGITNYIPSAHFWEGPSDASVFAQQSGIRLYARGYYSGLERNDLVQSIWRRPSGAAYATRSFYAADDYSRSGWYWSTGVDLPTVPDLGTWTVEYLVNGLHVGQERFEVTPQGEPEIRVEQPGSQIIVDGRFTPIDFGTANVGAPASTRTFTVINHGYDALLIGSVQVPDGYVLTEGLDLSIAPGATDTFTVALTTSTGGYFGGEIKIASNDEDESLYNFAVEGTVTSPGARNLIVGIAEFQIAEGGRMVANVRRTGSTASPLQVTLATDDATELSLPATVSFAAGSDYAQFFIEAPSDLLYDGLQQVTVFASAAGYYGGRRDVGIVDDGKQRGDFTGDSLVTGDDFLKWQRGVASVYDADDLTDWKAFFGANAVARGPDFDADNDVDGNDLLLWQRGVSASYDGDDLEDWKAHFGASADVAISAAAVAETAATVGTALALDNIAHSATPLAAYSDSAATLHLPLSIPSRELAPVKRQRPAPPRAFSARIDVADFLAPLAVADRRTSDLRDDRAAAARDNAFADWEAALGRDFDCEVPESFANGRFIRL